MYGRGVWEQTKAIQNKQAKDPWVSVGGHKQIGDV